MKRLLPAALALSLLALSLLPTPGLAQDRRESTWKRVKREGVLRWGADPSGGAPFAFSDPDDPDHVVGFEIDIMDALARRLGVRAELVVGDWDSLIPSLQSGRIDLVLNGLEVNDERAEKVSFTTPYFRYGQQLVVRSADRDRYRSLDDLKGRRIAVLKASASVDVLKEQGWADGLIDQLPDSLTPFQELRQRRVEAALQESIIASYYVGGDDRFHIVPEVFSPGDYAAAVRKEDRELLDEVNKTLEEMKSDGELGEIYQRWDLWGPRQEELGIAKGKPTQVSPLAHRPTEAGAARWKGIAVALLWGAGYTLVLTAVSMPLALLVGLGLALMVRGGNPLLSWPALTYIQVVRGTPLLVQIYVIFFTLPEIGAWLGLGELLTWPALVVGVLCLSANYAAYEAEIHRAGLDAVPKGQREAALSLGMSERQSFLWIVLPQSFRIILPPVVNDLVSMLKDSCLVSVMGVAELLYVATSVGKATFMYAELLLIAAAIYFVLSLLADRLGKRLETRLRQRGTSPVPISATHH